MPEINFGLLQPVDVGALTQQGFSTGMAMVKHVQTKNALRSYLDNPDDPQAYNALAAYDPSAAATLQNQQLVRRKLQLDQQDRERAVALGSLATTNPRGAQQEALAAGDFDLADHFAKLDEDERTRRAEGLLDKGWADRVQASADRPIPAQRKAPVRTGASATGEAGVEPERLDQFDVTNDTARCHYSQGQKVSDLIEQGKIQWHQQGEQPSFATDYMGRPVGTQNPYRQGGPTPSSGQPSTGNSSDSRGVRNNNPLNLTESEFTRAQPGLPGPTAADAMPNSTARKRAWRRGSICSEAISSAVLIPRQRSSSAGRRPRRMDRPRQITSATSPNVWHRRPRSSDG
jgi:hypothetical protein